MTGAECARFAFQSCCSRGQRLRAAHRAGPVCLSFRTREQRGKVGADVRHGRQRIHGHVRQLQLRERPCDRPRKSRKIRDGREVVEVACSQRIEGRARGDGFGAQRTAGAHEPFGQHRQRQLHRDLGE